MKELFRIQNEDKPVQSLLLLQAGDRHLSFAVTNKEATRLTELAWCAFDQFDSEELASFLNSYPVLKEQHYDIMISFTGMQAALLPSLNFSAGDGEMILRDLQGAYEGCRIISEQVPGWQLYTAYAVNNGLWDWVNTIFPFAKYRHQHTLTIQQSAAASGNDCLYANIGTKEISLLLVSGGRVLLARQFEYATPEDVTFLLLKICREYSLNQQTALLRISGLVDKQSALYKELYQYFIAIDFREAGWQTGNNDFPLHYFTSLNDIATCVS